MSNSINFNKIKSVTKLQRQRKCHYAEYYYAGCNFAERYYLGCNVVMMAGIL